MPSSSKRQQTLHKAAHHFCLPFAADVFCNVAAAVTGAVKVPDLCNLQLVLANAVEMLWDDGHAVFLGKTSCYRKLLLQDLIWLHRWGTSTQLAYCHVSFLSLVWRSFIYFDNGICFASISLSWFNLCCPTMAADALLHLTLPQIAASWVTSLMGLFSCTWNANPMFQIGDEITAVEN